MEHSLIYNLFSNKYITTRSTNVTNLKWGRCQASSEHKRITKSKHTSSILINKRILSQTSSVLNGNKRLNIKKTWSSWISFITLMLEKVSQLAKLTSWKTCHLSRRALSSKNTVSTRPQESSTCERLTDKTKC